MAIKLTQSMTVRDRQTGKVFSNKINQEMMIASYIYTLKIL